MVLEYLLLVTHCAGCYGIQKSEACIYLPTLHVFTKSLQSYDKLQFKMCHKGVVHGHLPLEFRAGEKIGWKDLRRPCQVDDIWTGPPRINGIWLGRRKREHPEQTQEETGRRPGWCEVGAGVTRGSQTVWVLERRLTRFFLQIRGLCACVGVCLPPGSGLAVVDAGCSPSCISEHLLVLLVEDFFRENIGMRKKWKKQFNLRNPGRDWERGWKGSNLWEKSNSFVIYNCICAYKIQKRTYALKYKQSWYLSVFSMHCH